MQHVAYTASDKAYKDSPFQKLTHVFGHIPKVLQLIVDGKGGNDLAEKNWWKLMHVPGDEGKQDSDVEEWSELHHTGQQ